MIIRVFRRPWCLCTLAAMLLTACSSNDKSENKSAAPAAQSKPAEQKSEFLTGRVALQRLYTTARGWAGDAAPFRLESQSRKVEGSNAEENQGKEPIWRGYFASPSRGQQKPLMWSGVAGPDAPERGITPGAEDTFSAGNISTRPFNLAYLKIDSDKAFQVAQQHGGSALLKKTPQLPVNYALDWDARNNDLVWHVIYGENTNEPQLQIAVNASNGAYIRKE